MEAKKAAIVLDPKKHQKYVAEHLQTFLHDRDMCDVTLTTGDFSVQVHRVILAANSDYFHSMFSKNWAEKSKCEIKLHDLTPDGLKAIVEFSYYGKMTVDRDNIVEVLSAVHHCQFVQAFKLCEEFISQCIDEENFYEYLKLSEMYNLKQLEQNLAKSANKLFLPKAPVADIAKIVNLFDAVRPEFTELVLREWDFTSDGFSKIGVSDIVTSWMKNDLEQRERYVHNLLSAVWGDDADVDEIWKYFRLSTIERKEHFSSGITFLTILDDHNPFSKRGSTTLVVNKEVENRELVKLINPVPLPSLYEGDAVVVNDMLYIITGDRAKSPAVQGNVQYDPCIDRFIQRAPLPEPRHRFVLVSVDKKLVVLGGCHSSSKGINFPIICHDDVDIYEPCSDSWSKGVPLPYPLHSHAAASSNEGLIYVTGGYKGKNNEDSNDNDSNDDDDCAEKGFLFYDPLKRSWIEKAEMKKAHALHSLVLHKDRLYQMDGDNNDESLEYYDLSTDTGNWVEIWIGVVIFGGVSPNGSFYFCFSEDDSNHLAVGKMEETDRPDADHIKEYFFHVSSPERFLSLRIPDFVFNLLTKYEKKVYQNCWWR